MHENEITRRQMLKLNSLAMLSSVNSPTLFAKSQTPDVGNIGVGESEVCFMQAVELTTLLKTKKISAREVMQAHLRQIEKINAKVNALVTLVPEDEC